MIILEIDGGFLTCESLGMYVILVSKVDELALEVVVAAAFQTSGCFSHSLFFCVSARNNFTEVALSFFSAELRKFRSAESFSVFEIFCCKVVSGYYESLSVLDVFSKEICVDNVCCLSGISDSFDSDGDLVITAVAACKYAGDAGHECFLIVCDSALSGLVSGEDGSVYCLADGKDHGVESDGLGLSFNGYRSSSSGFIGFAQFHDLENDFLNVSVLVLYDLKRIGEVLEDNSLFLSFLDLDHVSRHLVLGTTIDVINFLCAHSDCCTAGVHSGVSSADDGNSVAQLDLFVGNYLSQEVDTADDSVSIFALASNAGGYPCADSQENCVIVSSDGLKRNVLTNLAVCDDLNSHSFDGSDLFIKNCLGKSVFRNTVSQHTAAVRH